MKPGRTGRLVALLTVVGCATSLLAGAVGGTGAYFTDSHFGSVQISLADNLVIQVSSDTIGAAISQDGATLTCPDVLILTASGDNGRTDDHGSLTGCDITVRSVDAVAPTHFTIKAAITSSGVYLARFTLHFAESAVPASIALNEMTPQPLVSWISLDNATHTLMSEISWVDLGNADMNGWIKVTYTIDAAE